MRKKQVFTQESKFDKKMFCLLMTGDQAFQGH